MKQHKRRIENLERAMNETIRVIVKRDAEPEKVLVMRRDEPPHQTYTRALGESAHEFLRRAGCMAITAGSIANAGH